MTAATHQRTAALCACIAVAFVAATVAVPSHGYKPPNCPQLIKAAQENETQAGVALAMAVKNMNETLTALNKMVADAKLNQATEDQKYQAALTLYNQAMNQHDAATTALQNDQNKLKNIQNECKQPVKPPNCPKLISAQQQVVQQDEKTVDNTENAMQQAKTEEDAQKKVLDGATAAYWNAVATKNTTVAQLQANLTAAIQFQKDATEWYQQIVIKCQ